MVQRLKPKGILRDQVVATKQYGTIAVIVQNEQRNGRRQMSKPHELNGEHDCATVRCLSTEADRDVWHVIHKASAVEGRLTIFHNEQQYEGFDWDQEALLEEDGSASEALQEVIDILSAA